MIILSEQFEVVLEGGLSPDDGQEVDPSAVQ
jgi:hypothetical protein